MTRSGAAMRTTPASRGILGVGLGLAAALAFGAGGTIVKPLFSEGWTPGAAVFARLVIAALVLAVPALLAVRGDLRPLWRARWVVLAYAALAVAGVQLAFYASLQRIPVSIALLIEYLAPVALLLLAWVRTRRMPHRLVLIGAAVALAGLVLVIGPTGGAALDPIGVALAAVAMIGVAVYYVIGAKMPDGIPPITLAWAGFVIGAIVLGLAGAVGVLPMHASFGEADFLGTRAPWWVPLVVVGVISTAFAYVAGITAITLLGTRVASFLGLSEVVFAGIVGWIVLGEAIGPVALLGAALILGGIVLVRLEPEGPVTSPLAEPLPVTEPVAIVADPG
ncbi:EamA family transporter [Protaetiibacter intestinalis]|uniref:EamA/RhaT family transporter n=1 Tax=Protaetiibacter intestinalis TaxID=2419774 RepID=A0A387B999_9MICO|nr:EamA family transporter [Protaetiibacter intestinalis]AYF98421.1 EamA/RhaT family transporter [Protaetiibacter intestinalis]